MGEKGDGKGKGGEEGTERGANMETAVKAKDRSNVIRTHLGMQAEELTSFVGVSHNVS